MRKILLCGILLLLLICAACGRPADGEALDEGVFLLGDRMDFSADDVTEILLEEYENYSDGVTRVRTSAREDIEKITGALAQATAREFAAGEDPGAFIGIGGNGYFCTLTLRDGSSWKVNPRHLTTVTSERGEEDMLVLSIDHEAVFGLLTSGGAPARLVASIGDITPTLYEKAYGSPERDKSMTHLLPMSIFFDNDPVLAPAEAYTCRLEWLDDAGGPVRPAGISATLYEGDAGEIDWMSQTIEGRSVPVEGDTLTLPGSADRRFVVVRAELADGRWAESVFAYRATIFPTAFYDISYGNDEGGVTLTRTDAGVEILGTQNRKYVDFILGLELSPSDGGGQTLPVREPFAMTFSCDGTRTVFAFDREGVSMDGAPYRVGNPQILEELYTAFDPEDASIFERIDYSTRGFLSRDVAYFVDTFPIAPTDIASFTIVREQPEQRVRFDESGMAPEDILEILGHVVMGSDWQPDDYYFSRRFYLSYEVTLTDGTVYEIGERIQKNGVETGWHTIQSDAPSAASRIEGQDGAVETRETPIFGGYSVDDAGNVRMG